MELLNKVRQTNFDSEIYLPIYFSLSSIRNTNNLIQEIFLMNFGLSVNEAQMLELCSKYKILLIGDGYDEQLKEKWCNLYLVNDLSKFKNLKFLITSRINGLPSQYEIYFLPYHPGSRDSHGGYDLFYIQPFQDNQIDFYIDLYLTSLEKDSSKLQFLDPKWKEKKTYQEVITSTSGLQDLMKTPLICRLSLEALPYLLTSTESTISKKIVRGQIYEAFLIKLVEQEKKKTGEIDISLVWKHGEDICRRLYSDSSRKVEIDLQEKVFQFNFPLGRYVEKLGSEWRVLISDIRTKYLPLQHIGSNK